MRVLKHDEVRRRSWDGRIVAAPAWAYGGLGPNDEAWAEFTETERQQAPWSFIGSTCVECGERMYADQNITTCSDRCYAERKRRIRRESAQRVRARWRSEPGTCWVCRGSMEGKRADAQTCSTKCRVALSRMRAGVGG